MKTKLITMAGGLACVFATTAMPICAEELYNAISGSGVSLGLNENFEPGGLIALYYHTAQKKWEEI